MKLERLCLNHPKEEAVSICQHCHDWLCLHCRQEGPEYYYCHKPECLEALEALKVLKQGACKYCGERILFEMIHCPACGKQLREIKDWEKRDDLVTISRYSLPIQAQLARTILESVGIESYVLDENVVALNPGYNYAFGGVRLQVRKSESRQASIALGIKE